MTRLAPYAAAAPLLADLPPPQAPPSAASIAPGPLAEPPPSSVFSVSSVLNDSRPNAGGYAKVGDDRSQIAIN